MKLILIFTCPNREEDVVTEVDPNKDLFYTVDRKLLTAIVSCSCHVAHEIALGYIHPKEIEEDEDE